MRTKRRTCAALGLLLLCGVSANAKQTARPPRYTVTNLGTVPGYDWSKATGLNDKGQVIGTLILLGRQILDRGYATHLFLWKEGQMRDLGTLKSPYGEDYQIQGSGINNRGQIVGTLFTDFEGAYSGERRVAFIWSGGGLRFLTGKPVLPFQGTGTSLSELTDSEAAAINDRGEVVGTAGWTSDNPGPHGPRHAFLYRNKHVRDLGPGTATGINNKGEVCGYVPLDEEGRPNLSGDGFEQSRIALLWTKGRWVAMGRGIPYAISDSGVIVGSIFDPASLTHYDDLEEKTNFFTKERAALWKQRKFYALDTGGNLPGKAQAVNRQGQIVGGHWLWQNGRTYDLNELIPNRAGWTLQQATGINNRGQIVGGGMFQGKKRAFLLTPGR